jgi:molybdenum cofactor guanylyltransferase
MITGLILAGGQSSRMGCDKALIEMERKSLLQIQIERLEASGCIEVLISAPKDRGYEKFGGRVVEDSVPNIGPMGGLYSGLSAAPGDRCLAIAVDLPNLTIPFLKWVIQQAEGYSGFCPQSERGFEPLCAVYDKRLCLPIIKRRIEAKRFSLQELIAELLTHQSFRLVPSEDWKIYGTDLLRNWNEP